MNEILFNKRMRFIAEVEFDRALKPTEEFLAVFDIFSNRDEFPRFDYQNG